MVEDIAFPRGGRRQEKRPLEETTPEKNKKGNKGSKETSVENDFLFGTSSSAASPSRRSKKQKTSSSSTSTGAHSLLPLGGGGVVLATKKKKSKGQTAVQETQQPVIEAFGFSKLAKGTKVLGCVREVQEEFAVISLPNMLTGYVLKSSERSLKQLYAVGQTLAVVVQKVVTESIKGGGTRKRIQVSGLPNHVNPRKDELSPNVPIRGQIVSVEDHGCLIDLGLGRKGFVKFVDVESKQYTVLDDDEEEPEEDYDANSSSKNKGGTLILQPGRLYDFLVTEKTSSASKGVVTLQLPTTKSLAKMSILPPVNKHSSPFTLSSIMPGWMVTAKVEAEAKNGLCVTFLGNVFRGAIELGHLGGYFVANKTSSFSKEQDHDPWKKVFHNHQHFAARVIAVDVPTKLIRLSLSGHLIDTQPPRTNSVESSSQGLPEIGKIVEDCTVVRLDPGIGALLALPAEYNRDMESLPKHLRKSELHQNDTYKEAAQVRAVYVHISKAMDEKDTTSAFSKDFALATTHSVRILSCGNLVDGIASGACAPSILEAHVLTHADLKPGQVYKQVPVCAQLRGGSILVSLGATNSSNSAAATPIKGLVPPLHLFESNSSSEFRRKLLKAKYAVDARLDVRVLWVDTKMKKCLVTTKKSIVKAKEAEIITNYNDITLGQTATGYISKVDANGVFVTFCNRVYGRVTARSLVAELGIQDPRQNYQLGDVVSCRVIRLRKRERRRSTPFVEENEDYDEESGSEEEDENQSFFWELTLSLKTNAGDDDEEMEDEAAANIDVRNPKQVKVQAGSILPNKSMKIVQLVKGKNKPKGGFIPGHAVVNIKAKYLLDKETSSNMLSYMECKLPYDQLLDKYPEENIVSAESLDELAERVLAVGKKINQKAIILTDPRKSNVDYSSGIGKMPIVSIRKTLIQTAEKQNSTNDSNPDDILFPSSNTQLFVGALLQGYVAQIDKRHGAFVRFLDGMTGMVPRSNGGLDLPRYSTVVTRVQVIDDTKKPHRILLEPVGAKSNSRVQDEALPFKSGDIIKKAKVSEIDFFKTSLEILDAATPDNVKTLLHCTMKESSKKKVKASKKKSKAGTTEQEISKGHPFYELEVGETLKNLRVVSARRRKGSIYVHVTDRIATEESDDEVAPTYVDERSQLKPGMITSGIVTGVAASNKGLYVQVSPNVKGFIPGLELSHDLNILNNISGQALVGWRIKCCVVDEHKWHSNRAKCPFATHHERNWADRVAKEGVNAPLFLSVVACEGEHSQFSKPSRNDLVIGKINKSLHQTLAPSLMIELRGGFVGRCCITEMDETDDWENMPIGNIPKSGDGKAEKEAKNEDDEDNSMDVDEEDSSSEDESEADGEDNELQIDESFPDGRYVACRVLKAIPKQSVVDVSLRESRVDGNLDDDEVPKEGDKVQGYVIKTIKKGCFVRLSRHVDAHVTLKELCDGFLPDPSASFPPGRLVVGKVKAVKDAAKKSKHSNDPVKFHVDLDMRESTLLEKTKRLTFDEIELQSKYKGTVTRVESYGVFVQIENSAVSGLTHLSECSDKFIKNLQALYNPGDLVKILVIKKDSEAKRLGFSMKASHFEDDEDSDDDSSAGDDSSNEDEEMADMDEIMGDAEKDDDLDSDDEDFASKLAAKMQGKDSDAEDDDSSDEEQDGDSDSDDDDSESDDEDERAKKKSSALDTDVGFDWGGFGAKQDNGNDSDSSDDSDSEDEEDNEDGGKSSSHKSRKKQAQRRREEKEIAKREIALADGTADENPETAGDFERLLAGNPNSSELWIRYMAFHLSLADIPSARAVADKALDRIEFRQEGEKLNVWTAVLTLEHKYGSEKSFQSAIDRACGQSNPKQVYLRACEILEKDVSTSPDAATRANDMFAKMCKKFKSKKKVWLAHLEFLLKQTRHQEAHALLKRALLSLAPYKHAETMSRFAQLEFEFGSGERARTVFDGLVLKYPKRLDLFFVYLDKEIKFGKIKSARKLLERKVEERKLSDKQMKSLFKKWYRMEEQHGTEETQAHVKDAARSYVEQSAK